MFKTPWATCRAASAGEWRTYAGGPLRTFFNPADRYECMKTIPARITPKDAFNTCDLFEAKTTVERKTGSMRQTSAHSAFNDLFK